MVEKYTDSKQDMWKEYARTEIGNWELRNFIPKVMHFFNIGEFWDVFPHIVLVFGT